MVSQIRMRIAIPLILALSCLAAVLAQDGGAPLSAGMSQSGSVAPGQYNFYSYTSPSGFAVEFRLQIASGDADLFVTDSPAERPIENSGAPTTSGRESGNVKRVVLQMAPHADRQVFSIGVLGRGTDSASYTVTATTHPYAEPAALAPGNPVTNKVPMLQSYAVTGTAGTDLNFTVTAAGSGVDFFVDPGYKWPSFLNYRYVRHIPADSAQNVLVPVANSGPIYVSFRPISSAGTATVGVAPVTATTTPVTESAPAQGSLSNGQYAFHTFTAPSGVGISAIEFTAAQGDVELYVSPHMHERPTRWAHVWRATDGAKQVVVAVREATDSQAYVVAVHMPVGSSGSGSYALNVRTIKSAAPTAITAGQTLTNSFNNSLPAYYVFDATSDDVDLNVTITADAVGGVEFFADRSEQFPSFARYLHFNFVPAGRSMSTLLCVHSKGPFYFAVRPVAVGSTPSINIQSLKHSVTTLADNAPTTGTVGRDAYKFFNYETTAGVAVEFVLSITQAGDAEMYVTDNPQMRPIDGVAPYTTVGTDAPPAHKTIIIMLPQDTAPRSFQVGVRGNADSSSDSVSFSVTARTQPFLNPTPLALGQNTTHTDLHTMPGFYVFSVDAADADLNVTLSTNSSRGAHFFASTDYKYPSFARYQWFRHIQQHQPASVIVCAHNGAPVYATVRALSHGGVVSIHVQRATHKIGVMDQPAGFAAA